MARTMLLTVINDRPNRIFTLLKLISTAFLIGSLTCVPISRRTGEVELCAINSSNNKLNKRRDADPGCRRCGGQLYLTSVSGIAGTDVRPWRFE